MKNYNALKLKAVELRKNGQSYGEIKKELNLSKSTLSSWLRDIALTEEQKKHLYTKNVLILNTGYYSQKERRLREVNEITEKAKKEISKSISLESYRLFGAALYWAEGNKTKSFGITNSDPHLILFMVEWFYKIFEIPPGRLKAWLNIYPQQNDLEIKKFWSKLTNIPLGNFGKSFVKPLSKSYKKNNLYYGTIKILVPKGTDMRYKMFGWVKAVLNEVSTKTTSTQKEWRRLEISRAVNLPKM